MAYSLRVIGGVWERLDAPAKCETGVVLPADYEICLCGLTLLPACSIPDRCLAVKDSMHRAGESHLTLLWGDRQTRFLWDWNLVWRVRVLLAAFTL